jgi:hypothetical protein
VLGFGLLLLVPSAWLLAHRFSSRALPPAPWTERDLPTIPDAAENGLAEVVLPGSWSLDAVDSEIDVVELAGALDAVPPEERWGKVHERQRALEAWASHEPERRARELARIDAALAARFFAEPCTSVGSDCRMLKLVELTRVAIAADYAAALGGEWKTAFERARALLEASNKLVPSARTAVGTMVSIFLARAAVDHLRVLVAGYRAEVAGGSPRTAPDALRSRLDAVETALGVLRRGDVSGRRAVIAECLWIRGTLRPVLEDPASQGGRGGWLLRYAVDVRGSLAASDARFVALMRWVEAPDHATRPPPVFREHASGRFWWLWNPGGKALLDLGSSDVGSIVRQLDRRANELFVSRAALRAELRALAP